jgi:hypothetical protein
MATSVERYGAGPDDAGQITLQCFEGVQAERRGIHIPREIPVPRDEKLENMVEAASSLQGVVTPPAVGFRALL